MAWFILSEVEGTPAHHERAEESLTMNEPKDTSEYVSQ